MGGWAKTCQAAVDAIRKAGATEHYIFLPGKLRETRFHPGWIANVKQGMDIRAPAHLCPPDQPTPLLRSQTVAAAPTS